MMEVTADEAEPGTETPVREIRIAGKGGKPRTVRIGHQAARSLDRYLRARTRHARAHLSQLWLGVSNRGPLTPTGIYQIITRRGRQCGVTAYPHWFRHHFSHTWLDRGGPCPEPIRRRNRTAFECGQLGGCRPTETRRHIGGYHAVAATSDYDVT